MTFRRLAHAALVLLAAALPAPAQSNAPPAQQQSARPGGAAQPGDRSEVDRLLERAAKGEQLTDAELDQVLASTPHEEVSVSMIMVPMVVVDHKGRPVGGLTVKDFKVEDLGKQRPITWFSEEMNRPFRMALLLDVSESMSLEVTRRRLEQALVPIGREVGLVDRLMLLSFSDHGVQQRSGWSDRPMALIDDALRVAVHGRTAVVDALAAAAKQFPDAPKERQAIVLVTDGMDNASELTVADAVEAARAVDVPVYVLLLGGLDREIQNRRFTGSPLRGLEEVAEETGGRAFLIDDPAAAERAAAQIRDDLRHQYWLSFHPASPPDGRFRPIAVSVKRWGLRVRTRAGYR
jgi:Ca-activated chloride channel homolog